MDYTLAEYKSPEFEVKTQWLKIPKKSLSLKNCEQIELLKDFVFKMGRVWVKVSC